MINSFLVLALFYSVKMFAADTEDDPVSLRVRFRGMSEQEKRASLKLDWDTFQKQVRQSKGSSMPHNSPPSGQAKKRNKNHSLTEPLPTGRSKSSPTKVSPNSKKLRESTHSDPLITERTISPTKLSPTQRLQRVLSPRKSNSETSFSIIGKQNVRYIDISQESPLPEPKKKKRFFSRSKKRDNEILPCRINKTTQDNPRYGAYINYFSLRLEKNLLKLFKQLPLDEHLQPITELTSMKLREVYMRQSRAFDEEYKILRHLWKPSLNAFFSEFIISKNSECLPCWMEIVSKHFGMHAHAVELGQAKRELEKNSKGDDVYQEDFSQLEMQDKVAAWHQIIEQHSPKDNHEEKKCEILLDENEITYIDFLFALSKEVAHAPYEHKYFFYKLAEALESPLAHNAAPNSAHIQRLVLTNFLLYVIQPLILEMRIPPNFLHKEVINGIEAEIVARNKWQFPLQLNVREQKILVKEMTLEMTRTTLGIPLTTKLQPDKNEILLIQVLNKTFEPIDRTCDPDSFIGRIEGIKQQLISSLLKPPRNDQWDDNPFEHIPKHE